MNCVACDTTLPNSYFSKNQQKKDASVRRCKECILDDGGNIWCYLCRKSYSQNQFSNTQLKKSDDNRKCRNCINGGCNDFDNNSDYYYISNEYEFDNDSDHYSSVGYSSVHSERDSLPIPYAGIEGKWVAREEFPGRQSFAFYQCETCRRRWMSSRGLKDYGQQCKDCNADYQMARYMWLNEVGMRREDRHLEDNNIAHMSEHCEACKDGVCNGRNYLSSSVLVSFSDGN